MDATRTLEVVRAEVAAANDAWVTSREAMYKWMREESSHHRNALEHPDYRALYLRQEELKARLTTLRAECDRIDPAVIAAKERDRIRLEMISREQDTLIAEREQVQAVLAARKPGTIREAQRRLKAINARLSDLGYKHRAIAFARDI